MCGDSISEVTIMSSTNCTVENRQELRAGGWMAINMNLNFTCGFAAAGAV